MKREGDIQGLRESEEKAKMSNAENEQYIIVSGAF